jgi:hypothetical protein
MGIVPWGARKRPSPRAGQKSGDFTCRPSVSAVYAHGRGLIQQQGPETACVLNGLREWHSVHAPPTPGRVSSPHADGPQGLTGLSVADIVVFTR